MCSIEDTQHSANVISSIDLSCVKSNIFCKKSSSPPRRISRFGT